ncbi:MAG: hypothetical protein AAF823_04085 [Planctomycetota bacterium]
MALTGDAAQGYAATIEPLPGHGDLVAFATPARLEPAAALLGDVIGVRARLAMQPRADADTPARPADGRRVGADDADAVEALPIVRKMKEVFGDYHVRLIAQRREAPLQAPAVATDPDDADTDDADAPTSPTNS